MRIAGLIGIVLAWAGFFLLPNDATVPLAVMLIASVFVAGSAPRK